jgi:uncharacterized membrane protein SirB2
LTPPTDAPVAHVSEEARIMSSLEIYTLAHVVISLVGIGSGFVVLIGLLSGRRLDGWTALFLVTTVATSATGYGFPFTRLLPSHVVGAISLVVLAVAVYARYARRLTGRWRATYAVCAVAALYFNVFVLVVQSFLKIPILHALAPTQSEPPFAIAQLVVLAAFIVLGVRALRRSKSSLQQPAA